MSLIQSLNSVAQLFKHVRNNLTQQETEIKRLKESLDIRNKRIIQLESMVGEASAAIGSRTQLPEQPTVQSTANIAERVSLCESMIQKLNHKSCSNNVVVNTCSAHPKVQFETVASQTEIDSLTDEAEQIDHSSL